MSNIVNTPIIMYVNEHTLELDGSSPQELMEKNTYPIKIYTNENLDGCQLVKKLQNNQVLTPVSNLKREVKKLFRSENNETNEKKAWWVFLESLNETAEISGKEQLLYGGILKTYIYEEIPTIIPGVNRRAICEVQEVGELKGYFNDDTYNTFIITMSPENYNTQVFSNGILTTDFQNIPEPLIKQTEVKIPESINLANLNLEKPSQTFELNSDIIINTIELSMSSYDEEEGKYYYQNTLEQQLLGKTIPKNESDLSLDLNVNALIEIICKISEDNFSNYSIEVNINFEPVIKDSVNIEITEEDITFENETISIGIDNSNFTNIDYGEISYIEDNFDLEEILFNETADDYSNIYTLENIKYLVDSYNTTGLNEFMLGIRHLNEGEIDYITNSIRLSVIPSIESDFWVEQNYNIKTCYSSEKKEEDGIIKFVDNNNAELEKQVNNIYIDRTVEISRIPKIDEDGVIQLDENNNIIYEPFPSILKIQTFDKKGNPIKDDSGNLVYKETNLTGVISDIKVYRWSPYNSNYLPVDTMIIVPTEDDSTTNGDATEPAMASLF